MQNAHKLTWLASFPRSGNTWLRALISAYINGGNIGINEIMQTGDKDPVYYNDIVKAPINEWTVSDQALIKPAAMFRMLEDAAGNLMLKTHDCNVDISGVSQIPHDITRCGIYIARDPRDVALSFYNHYGLSSYEEAVDKLLDGNAFTRFPNKGLFVAQLSWPISVASWLRDLPYPVYTLRYEDLMSKPYEILEEVVKFLKLDYDAIIAHKAVESCRFESFQKQEQQDGFREGVGKQFFHKGETQRWKTELSK
ncbi:MAG: hypothetical protein ACI9J2_002674, partial [Saprospiraceae bacterium]